MLTFTPTLMCSNKADAHNKCYMDNKMCKSKTLFGQNLIRTETQKNASLLRHTVLDCLYCRKIRFFSEKNKKFKETKNE